MIGEIAIWVAYMIPFYLLTFLLYFMIGNLSKTTSVSKILSGLVVLLGFMALFVAELGFLFIVITLLGYILGRSIKVKEETTKWVLKYCLAVSLWVSVFNLVYYSGLYDLRFLRYPDLLFDSRLVYYLLVGTTLTSGIVAVVYSILSIPLDAGVRINKLTITLLVIITYLIESQLHENISHPYWIHHPTISVITMVMFVLGWCFSSSEIFAWVKNKTSRFDFWKISVLYFVLYHAIIEVCEKGPGPMFDTDYLMICILVSPITLFFGAYCGRLVRLLRESN